MRLEHLKLLRSPKNGKELTLIDSVMKDGKVFTGTLTDGQNSFSVLDFIPRFSALSNYADSFSLQWGNHPDIMYELDTGLTLFEDRFWKETRWDKNLSGELILEAGCGTGCFTRYALSTGATIVSFDLGAGSVQSNYKKNGHNENLLIVQASIYEMPFPKNFDRVFCFGVLQHTPDPKKSFFALLDMLKPGGAVASDIYALVKWTRFHGMLKTKYFLRKFVPTNNPEKLYKMINWYVKLFWPLYHIIKSLPGGKILNQHILFDNYPLRLPNMRSEKFKEFAIVDIMDMLGASFDLPATKEEFLSWHKEAGLMKIDVDYGYNGLEGRGQKA